MNRFRVTDAARADLIDIWSSIAQDNPEAADRFIVVLDSRFPMLACMPEIGRQREELATRMRSFPVANYVIFCQPMEGGVAIARVLHGARDLPPLVV